MNSARNQNDPSEPASTAQPRSSPASTPSAHTLESLTQAFDDTLDVLTETHSELTRLRAELSDRPSLEATHGEMLSGLLRDRSRVAERLGLLVLERYLMGRRTTPPVAPVSKGVAHATTIAVARAEGGEVDVGAEDAPPHSSPIVPSASAADIAAFRERFGKSEGAASDRRVRVVPAGNWREVLRGLLQEVGEPPGESDTAGAIDELDLLDRVTAIERTPRWKLLPRDRLGTWIALLASRGRALMVRGDLPSTSRRRLNDVLVRLPSFVKEAHTGHVHGLARDHEPQGPSWRLDAIELKRLLDAVSIEVEEAPAPTSAPVVVTSSGRMRSAREVEPEVERERIPADWPCWDRVRGKRAVIIGGEPREQSRARLEKDFALEELEWVSASDVRRHEALVTRIAHHGVDLVLVIQNLVDHKTSQLLIDAAKLHGVSWALTQGYGATAIQHGIERFAALSGEGG